MLKYNYSTGDSYYVLLTGLVLTVLPATLAAYSGKWADAGKPARPLPVCPGPACANLREASRRSENARSGSRLFTVSGILLGAGWALLLYCAYMIATSTEVSTEWDPHKTLGVSAKAKKSEIRAAYRRLSLSHHPDKVPFYKRAEASKRFIEIGRALKVLTNKKARKNWERYGNPDGPGAISFGIALPEWVLQKNFIVVFYLGLLIAVPALLIRAWNRGEIDLRHSGLRGESMAQIRALEIGQLTFQTLVLAISNNTESLDFFLRSDESELLQQDLRAVLPTKTKISTRLLVLYAHMNRRLPKPFPKFIAACGKLCNAAFELSVRRKAFKDVLVCLEVMRSLSAGRLPTQSQLLQLPYVQPDHLPTTFGSSNSTSSVSSGGVISVRNQLENLMRDKIDFAECFTQGELEEMKQSAAAIPQLVIESLKFSGAPGRTPLHAESQGVQCDIVLKVSDERSGSNGVNTWVCAPNFPDPHENGVWVLLCSGEQLVHSRFYAFHQGESSRVIEFVFPIPEEATAALPVTVHVASPYYVASCERRTTLRIPKLTKKQKQCMKLDGATPNEPEKPEATQALHGNEDLLASFG